MACEPEPDGGEHDVQALRGHNYPVRFATFSPDGRRLASAARYFGPDGIFDEVILWDLATGRQVFNAPSLVHFQNTPLRFSPAGDRPILAGAAGGEQALEIWEATPFLETPAEKGPRTIPGWGEVVDPSGD